MAQSPPSAARDQVRNIVPGLIDLSERVLFGEVWERPGLSKRDRSLITCATLIALGREKQLVGHLQRALDNGLTKNELSELAPLSSLPGLTRQSSVVLGDARVKPGHDEPGAGM